MTGPGIAGCRGCFQSLILRFKPTWIMDGIMGQPLGAKGATKTSAIRNDCLPFGPVGFFPASFVWQAAAGFMCVDLINALTPCQLRMQSRDACWNCDEDRTLYELSGL